MNDTDIAIVGMACRFPGANSIEEFWHNLAHRVDSLNCFDDYHPQEDISTENKLLRFIKINNLIKNFDHFDAEFFDIPAREALYMDPQHRLFLETAWSALEHSGCNPDELPNLTGLYAGVYANYYLLRNIMPSQTGNDPANELAITIGNEKDHLTTYTAYKLNLKGPVMTIQATCSSSAAAVHMACESLLTYSADLMLAGGVTISVPQIGGYFFQEGGLLSSDGRIRAFDENASGTVYSNGVAVVVLKRLEDAIKDKNTIYAVIKGSAVNNDGSAKLGYTAPSIEGQEEVIKRAFKVANVDPGSISCIEGHGTGTPLGDSIEIEALLRVFQNLKPKKCALGSVKSNIGHLGPASGLSGLIKLCLSLNHQLLLPSMNCEQPNIKISADSGPFYINQELKKWSSDSKRRACLSSFGLGGTNVHIILEEAPKLGRELPLKSGQAYPFCLSAKNKSGLQELLMNMKLYIETHPEAHPMDLSYTLLFGRKHFPIRFGAIYTNLSDLANQLSIALDHYQHNVEIINKLPQEETALFSLTASWLSGHTVPWEKHLDFTHARRIGLPTYPFQRKKYWLDAKPSQAISQGNETASGLPDSDITVEMFSLWKKHLALDEIDLDDNFFEKGGSSLSATSLVSAIQSTFNVPMELKHLFDNPTVKGTILHVMDQLLAKVSEDELNLLLGELK